MIIGLLVLIVFTLIWFLPLLKKHRRTVKEPTKFYHLAFIAGVVCTLLAMACQLGFGYLLILLSRIEALQAPAVVRVLGFLKILIAVAVVEELLKFFAGRLIVKRVPELTEAGCMLLMGMVGIGFGFVEELGGSDLMSGILNGVLEMHLFFQLVMGAYMWRAWDAKRRGDLTGSRLNMAKGLLIPIVVHGVFDYFLMAAQSLADAATEKALLLMGIALVIGLVYAISSVVFAHRIVNRELSRSTAAKG